MLRGNRASVLVLFGGALACNSDDIAECDRHLAICDIADADCREHLYAQTACAREFEGGTVPPVAEITRDEFEQLLRGDVEPTEEERRQDAQIATSQRMLDLLAQGETSSDEAAIESYARGVLAFYSRVDASVTIIETNVRDVDRETAMFILSHEFVHAQQDEQIGLEDFFEEASTNADSDMAARSITEGEAMLFANVTLARKSGAAVSADAFDEYYAGMQQDLRHDAADPEAAGYTEISSLFAYSFGGQYVTHRWYADGIAGVLDLYDDPPPSTAAILRALASRGAVDAVDIPPLAVGTMPDDWSIIDDDTLGAWIVMAVARRGGIDDDTANELGFDWLGDHLIVVGGPTDAEVALAWTVRFASSGSAERFAAIADPPEGVRTIRQMGADVEMIIAVDDASLAMWDASFEHALVEPAPSLRSPPAARGVSRRLPRSIDAMYRREP